METNNNSFLSKIKFQKLDENKRLDRYFLIEILLSSFVFLDIVLALIGSILLSTAYQYSYSDEIYDYYNLVPSHWIATFAIWICQIVLYAIVLVFMQIYLLFINKLATNYDFINSFKARFKNTTNVGQSAIVLGFISLATSSLSLVLMSLSWKGVIYVNLDSFNTSWVYSFCSVLGLVGLTAGIVTIVFFSKSINRRKELVDQFKQEENKKTKK